MSTAPLPRLFTSRLVVRIQDAGRSILASLVHPQGSMHLGPAVEAITQALWDRQDPRPTEARLNAPGVPEDPDYRSFLVRKLQEAGLLVSEHDNEAAAWHALLEQEVPELPCVDQVELTNACPFTCKFCPRGLGQMTRPVGHLDLGLLAEIVEQVKHLPQRKPFGLHHFGDPLLHPKVAEAVRVVANAGLEPELSFNPILVKTDTVQALLDAGVGVIILSLDGLDTATLHAMRGQHAGEFAEVERRVEEVIALAAQRARPPTLMVSMVGTTLNRHQWRQLFQRYRRAATPWVTPVVRLLEDFGDPQIAPLAVRRLRQLCGSPYKFVSITWNGDVVPCCHDFDARIVYGNLRRQTLKEVWEGDALARFRERWKQQRFLAEEPCARCRWRVDLYMQEEGLADSDAWTEALWPGEPAAPMA